MTNGDLVVSGIGVVAPPDPSGSAEWFDYRRELGERGYKYLPRGSHYLLAAARRALSDAGLELDDEQRESGGVAVGSNNSMSVLHAEIDRTVLARGIAAVRPALAPYFSVNLALARLSLEHGLKGFSLTVHTPGVAGLEALGSGVRAVESGRAEWLLAGATEQRLDPGEPGAADSDDGSVVLVQEPAARVALRGGRRYGRCTVRTLFLPPSLADRPGASAHVGRLWRKAAAAAGLGEGTHPPVRLIAGRSRTADLLAEAVGPGVTRIETGPGCLRPALEVARLLREREPATVVVAADTGNLAIARVIPD